MLSSTGYLGGDNMANKSPNPSRPNKVKPSGPNAIKRSGISSGRFSESPICVSYSKRGKLTTVSRIPPKKD